jgi:hypothetical protein
MLPLQTTSRARGAHPPSKSGASRGGTCPRSVRDRLSQTTSLTISRSSAHECDRKPGDPNDPSPIFEHSAQPLSPAPGPRTEPPLSTRNQPWPWNSCPSKTPPGFRLSSQSPRLRTAATFPPRLTPRFSTQYSQKLIRHILDFPVTAAPPATRRATA